MSFIYNDSDAWKAVDPRSLPFGRLAPEVSSLDSSKYTTERPLSNVIGQNPCPSTIQFQVRGSTAWWDLARSYIAVTFKVLDATDSDITNTDNIMPISGFGNALFETVKVQLGSKDCSDQDDQNAHMTSFFREAFTQGFSSELDCFNSYTAVEGAADFNNTLATNDIGKEQVDRLHNSGTVTICYQPASGIWKQERYLPPVDILLTLQKSADARLFICDAAGAAKAPRVVMANMELIMHRVYPSDETASSINRMITGADAKPLTYPIVRARTQLKTIVAGVTQVTLSQCLPGQYCPLIAVGFTKSSNSADYETSPYAFSDLVGNGASTQILQIQVRINGVMQPQMPYVLDYGTGSGTGARAYLESYRANNTASGMFGPLGAKLDPLAWRNGYQLFGFNTNPSRTAVGEATVPGEIEQQQDVEIMVTFATATANNETCVIVGFEQNHIYMDSRYDVSADF